MRENRKTNSLLMICITLLIVLIVITFADGRNKVAPKKSVTPDLKTESMKTQIAKEDEFDMIKQSENVNEIIINVVETPIADFVYGFEAVDCLKVRYNSEEPYEVIFLADLGNVKNIEILKFYFDSEDKGTTIGIINGKNGQQVKISVDQVKFDNFPELHSDELTRLFSVQEDLLDIIVSNFEIVEYASKDIVLEDGYVMTETPYFNIPFSNEWKEYLNVEQIDGSPYKVVFSCNFKGYEPVELFTYMFGEGAEGILGYLRGVPVGLSIGTAEADKNWDEEQNDIFYNMREEMNYIIDHLVATGEFSFN